VTYIAEMQEDLPRAAQPEYLTDALRRAGALGAGRVRDVVVESSKATILSRIIRLRLSYDGPAADASASLILKTGLPERADARWNAGQYEVAFYTQVAAAIPEAPVPSCFDAVWNEDTNDWHLLLEDLTDSHFTLTYWPMPPVSRRVVGRSASRYVDRHLARTARSANSAIRGRIRPLCRSRRRPAARRASRCL
jgi:hypothetical protein